MKAYEFSGILTETGWMEPGFVVVNDQGEITFMDSTPPADHIRMEKIPGFVIPGFQNAHSHAFQYAMAGLTERHNSRDDFWSWRENMYHLALSVDPDQMEVIATMLYAEMLRHGYTSVAEFHYVHHDKNGNPYENLSEMGERLIAAASNAGIRITLIPMFYQMGGFGKPPEPGQRRFISPSTDEYLQLVEASGKSVKTYRKARLGVGVHSLRAVKAPDVSRVVAETNSELPFHLHIAEQIREVEDCMAFYQQRPVEWLLNNLEVGNRFHLVHATHLSDLEVKGIAASGAQVVLCPSTEGNLGDGLFSLLKFQEAGGKWSIGTDSHIGLSPMEELRILDYGQRIHAHQRNIFFSPGQNDSGAIAFHQTLIHGKAAMGNPSGYFARGDSFDAVVMDELHPLMSATSAENRLSTLIYAGDASFLLGTIVAGEWLVHRGIHKNYDECARKFSQVMKELGNR